MRKYMHFWACEVLLFAGGFAADRLGDFSPMFWLAIAALAVVIAFQTWPSEIEEGWTPEQIMQYRKMNMDARHRFLESFGMGISMLIVFFILVAVLVFAVTSGESTPPTEQPPIEAET